MPDRAAETHALNQYPLLARAWRVGHLGNPSGDGRTLRPIRRFQHDVFGGRLGGGTELLQKI
jgi:hypothetical protein